MIRAFWKRIFPIITIDVRAVPLTPDRVYLVTFDRTQVSADMMRRVVKALSDHRVTCIVTEVHGDPTTAISVRGPK